MDYGSPAKVRMRMRTGERDDIRISALSAFMFLYLL